MPRTIFVTGGSGFIGGEVCSVYVAGGGKVLAPFRSMGANAKNAWQGRGCGGVWGAALGLLAFLGCAPDIPHPTSSHSDSACRTCHVGRAGAPSSHDKSGCVSCHEPGADGPYPRLMPHRGGEVELCSLCHQDGTAGAPVTSHLHEQDCYTCHQASEYGPYPPTPSHAVSAPERASCLACHEDVDHSERPSCVDCHQR
jgi:hypothetical protein